MVNTVELTPEEAKWVDEHKPKIEETWGASAVVTLRRRLIAADQATISLHVLAVKQPGWDSAELEFEPESVDAIAMPALRESLFRDLAAQLGESSGDFRWQ